MLLLGLVQVVPVVGRIAVLGSQFRWAREAAWRISRPFSFGHEEHEGILRLGGIAFIVELLGSICLTTLFFIVAGLPFVGQGLVLVLIPSATAAILFILVMEMRCVLYESLEPITQFKQAWQLLKTDDQGALRIWGMTLLTLVPPALGALLQLGLFLIAAAISPGDAVTVVTMAISSCIWLLISVGEVFVGTIILRALGYWTAQFDPASWGSSEEGLPAGVRRG